MIEPKKHLYKSYPKIYSIYASQKERCNRKKCKSYKYYGEKGIKVEYSLYEFIKWYLNNKPKNKNVLCVGRIDHGKNYSLDNIRFETRHESTKERNERVGNPTPTRRCESFVYSTGETINTFESIHDCARFYKVKPGCVIFHCLGKVKKRKSYDMAFRYSD